MNDLGYSYSTTIREFTHGEGTSVVTRSDPEGDASLGDLLADAVAGVQAPRRCHIAAEFVVGLAERTALRTCGDIVTDDMLFDFVQAARKITDAWSAHDKKFGIGGAV